MLMLDDWNQCFADLGLRPPKDEAFQDLNRRYHEKHRAYHTLQHIGECFEQFRDARTVARSPGAVGIALWYHDAIYDTHAQDNEEKSADLACSILESAGADAGVLGDVRALILATRHSALPQTLDEGFLVDIDLSILGAEQSRFDEYERQVRKEYGWVDETMFRAVRAQILKGLLERTRIYTTQPFRDRLESKARANLSRSITTLI